MLSGRGKSATAWLGRLNKNGAPRDTMWLTTGIAQAMMLVAGFGHAGYLALLSFSTSLALIPYLLFSMYSFKCACSDRGEAWRLLACWAYGLVI
ncbi:hypothetical protein [Pseudomonas sp. PDM22]|uniref:hypothetical protein n=1 Tax=Pseudomonas sp. PDM22 TaxID=2769287 RepID=UPI001CE070C4|nr:hypothetical protein [Pseudomonas sp. PDM22]